MTAGPERPFNVRVVLTEIDEALRASGLRVRGAFHPAPGDRVPGAAGTVVLVGNAGPAMWAAFTAAVDAARRRDAAHPLDTWTRAVVEPVARHFGARAVYPFEGPPFHPFQRWARRAGAVHPSPIGPLIDPAFGLWHAYRAALLTATRLPVDPPPAAPSPCATCAAAPCLTACPVDAIRRHRTDVAACTAHVRSPAGADCRENGCRARRACPVGTAHRYPPEQARFHIEAFLAAR